MNPKREGNGRPNQKLAPQVRPNTRLVRLVSWSDIPSDVVSDLVALCTKHGAAIMFGRTSDGGALSLCVLDNTNKVKEYPRDETDVHNFYTWLLDEYFSDGGKPIA